MPLPISNQISPQRHRHEPIYVLSDFSFPVLKEKESVTPFLFPLVQNFCFILENSSLCILFLMTGSVWGRKATPANEIHPVFTNQTTEKKAEVKRNLLFSAGSRAQQGNKKMNKPVIDFFFMEQRHSY